MHSLGIHRVFPAFSRRFHRLFRVLFLDAKGGIYYNITVKSKAAATDGNNVEYHEGAGVISSRPSGQFYVIQGIELSIFI